MVLNTKEKFKAPFKMDGLEVLLLCTVKEMLSTCSFVFKANEILHSEFLGGTLYFTNGKNNCKQS